MKKSLLAGLLLPFTVMAQTQTLTLHPNATVGKDAFVSTLNPTTNYGTYVENDAIDWTVSGTPFTSRSFIYFDLSALPVGATIISANMNLYGLTSSSNSQLSTGSNSCYLQNVTSTWNESTVTWNNQPTTTTTNEVTLAQSTSTSENYLNINVLSLVNDQITNSYYGFMLRLLNETTYNSMVFGSSDNTDTTKWPMLVVQYSVTTTADSTCITLQPDTSGKDAFVTSLYPTTNLGNYTELDAISWTNSGTAFNSRGLIQFDLSSIPTSAVVTSAVLSLYGDTSTSNTQGSTGSNAAYLNMITSAWQENAVTWNNQPTTSTTNQVTLAQSTSTSQNYPNIDVLNFVQNWVASPSTNYGMMLQLQTEATYRSLVLCSSDYPHPGQHPKLEVCYKNATAIKNNSSLLSDISIYPNPVNTNLNISLGASLKANNTEVSIMNVLGQSFNQSITKLDNFIQVNTESLAAGNYVILIKNIATGEVVYKKVIKE
jgi:type IX secretion system substrate protein